MSDDKWAPLRSRLASFQKIARGFGLISQNSKKHLAAYIAAFNAGDLQGAMRADAALADLMTFNDEPRKPEAAPKTSDPRLRETVVVLNTFAHSIPMLMQFAATKNDAQATALIQALEKQVSGLLSKFPECEDMSPQSIPEGAYSAG